MDQLATYFWNTVRSLICPGKFFSYESALETVNGSNHQLIDRLDNDIIMIYYNELLKIHHMTSADFSINKMRFLCN